MANCHHSDCGCSKSFHCLDHKHHCCTDCRYDDCRHCGYHCYDSHDFCSSCHSNDCRRFICDDDFRIRLAGLQGGLNFRLSQLLGCEVEIELDNDKKIKGTIGCVGSNFVELLTEKEFPWTDEEDPADEEEEVEEGEEEELCCNCKKKKHKKCRTVIFPIDKIFRVELKHSCSSPCICR